MAKKKPFHMHALTKASATHLLNHGHISKRKHAEIVKDAEAGMAKTRPKVRPQGAPMMAPPAPAPMMPSDDDGDEI